MRQISIHLGDVVKTPLQRGNHDRSVRPPDTSPARPVKDNHALLALLVLDRREIIGDDTCAVRRVVIGHDDRQPG